MGCSEACSRAPTKRSASCTSRARRHAPRRPAVIRPVVTVPVLSSTIVSTRRVDSSTSGPLISTPSCAPRPVPTSSAVGVARPNAHGQAMISTETAAREGSGRGPPRPASRPGSTPRARARPARRHRRRGRPAAGRRLARLGLADQPARSGRAPCPRRRAWRARQAPAGVHRRAGDIVTRPDLDGHGLAREQRSSTAERPDSTTPSVATFSPGTHDEHVADRERSDGHDPPVDERDLLRPELEQRPQGRARGAPGALPPGSGRQG